VHEACGFCFVPFSKPDENFDGGRAFLFWFSLNTGTLRSRAIAPRAEPGTRKEASSVSKFRPA
jgi:hypothetical protein